MNVRVGFIVALGVMVFVCLQASGGEWDIVQLIDNGDEDYDPRVSGSNIVWLGSRGGNGEIFVYDDNTGVTTRVTENLLLDDQPDIWGSYVVWIQDTVAGDWEVFLYDIDANLVTQVTNDDHTDHLPKVSGSNVVYQHWTGSQWDIWLYNGTATTQLSVNSHNDEKPQISGLNVVWEGHDGSDYEIFVYEIGADVTKQITNKSGDDRDPQVSGSKVVWKGHDGSDYEIFVYNITTVITTQLTNNAREERNPQISGSRVVWGGHDGNDWEIFLHDIDANVTTQITDNDKDDYRPQVSEFAVAWEGSDGNDWEIFAYNGTATTQLTDNSADDRACQISGRNIVWEGDEGGDREIYLARPRGVHNTTQDTWYVTIQDAIDDANEGDEIEVYPGIYEGDGNRDLDFGNTNMTVRSTNPCDPNIVDATIIDCGGDANYPSDANYHHRGFYFHSGEDANSVVAGLTIRNGYVTGEGGYDDPNARGGGIACQNASSPTIRNCTLRDNYASAGGGVSCSSAGSDPQIIACTISGNEADNGGGIFCRTNAHPCITGCRICDNEVTGAGGGVACYDNSDPNITNCTIDLNKAELGGGIYSLLNSHPEIVNCTVVLNTVAVAGGGIYTTLGCSSTVRNCIVWYNAPDQIGGIDPLVTYSCIQDCGDYCTNPDAHNIADDPNFVDLDGADDDPNTCDNDYHLTLDSPCLDAGDPNGDYSGQTDIDGEPRVMWLEVDMGSDEHPYVHNMTQGTWHVTIQDAIDDANDADEIVLHPWTYTGDGNRDIDFGGLAIAVRSTDPNDPNVVAATIIDCGGDANYPSDANYHHRGFYFDNGEDENSVVAGLTIENGYIVGNGGVIYFDASSPMIANCTISGNTASNNGGALYCAGTSSPTITNCTISGNRAQVSSGGAINCAGTSSPTITNCTISGNRAFGSGGAIYCYPNTSPTITNCTIIGNTASGGGTSYGGGICCNDNTPVITNCTISGNTASTNGGGIFCDKSSAMITNCILWGDTPDEIDVYASAGEVVRYSDVQGGYTGEGNINEDPCFVDPNGTDGDPNNDYHLDPNSLCINAGDPSFDPNLVSNDMDGQPRVMGCRVDMGVYEWQQQCCVYNETQDAYRATIQAAINLADPSDEIVLEPCTYEGDGNRDIDPNGLAITIRSTDPDDPNVVAATIIDCGGDANYPSDANYHHRGFHFHSGEDANTVVAGLTIENGYTTVSGGGILCDGSSPMISNCVIRDSSAVGSGTAYGGGGLACVNNGDAIITECTFEANLGDHGGGLFCKLSSPEISKCAFIGNSAGAGGALATEDTCSPTITNCWFLGNIGQDGGAIYNRSSCSPRIYNCEFIENEVTASWGGGMVSHGNCYPRVVNCLFTGNAAPQPGGAISSHSGSDTTILNCILWQNSPDEISLGGGSVTVTYSDVEGGTAQAWFGEGCIDADPRLVDPNGPDGDPNTWDDNDYHLSPNSPCINAGDPNFEVDPNFPNDVDGDPRVIHDRVDMGSDEFSGQVPYYELVLTVKNPDWGTVYVDPNGPNWPDYPIRYPVTLTAVPSDPNTKSFKKWRIRGPNDANDPNYQDVIDTNNPLHLTMDGDYNVRAFFKCGGGGGIEEALSLLIVFTTLGFLALRRRR